MRRKDDMRFEDMVDVIYLNSHLSRDDARKLAIYCWNHDISKADAVAMARAQRND